MPLTNETGDSPFSPEEEARIRKIIRQEAENLPITLTNKDQITQGLLKSLLPQRAAITSVVNGSTITYNATSGAYDAQFDTTFRSTGRIALVMFSCTITVAAGSVRFWAEAHQNGVQIAATPRLMYVENDGTLASTITGIQSMTLDAGEYTVRLAYAASNNGNIVYADGAAGDLNRPVFAIWEPGVTP
jgi:hypothetical protein